MRKMLLISVTALALPAMALAQTSTTGGGMPNSSTGAMDNGTSGTTGGMQNGTTGAMDNGTAGMQNGATGTTDNGGTGGAMSSTTGTAGGNNAVSAQDRQFVDTAAKAGLYEVQEGQLAASKGDDSVKAVGNRMVTDHTRINDQLKSIAQADGISVPDQPSTMQSDQISHLQGLSSQKKFDKEYLKDQRHAHEKAIKLFQKEADSGTNPDLKSFAAKTIPTLQSHLQMIKSAK